MRLIKTLLCVAVMGLGMGAQAQTVAPRPDAVPAPAVLDWDTAGFWAMVRPAQAYDCSRKTCTQIRSCDEACYKLQVCGHSERDGDGDGIPCENLCTRRC